MNVTKVTCEQWMWQKLNVNNEWQKLPVNNRGNKSYLWTMDVTKVTCEQWMLQKLTVNNGCYKSYLWTMNATKVTCEQWMLQKLPVDNGCDKSYLWTMDVTKVTCEQWMLQKLHVNNGCYKSYLWTMDHCVKKSDMHRPKTSHNAKMSVYWQMTTTWTTNPYSFQTIMEDHKFFFRLYKNSLLLIHVYKENANWTKIKHSNLRNIRHEFDITHYTGNISS
jgi:phage-related protein